MVNSKKVIAGLGVVAGLGVAMLPLTTFATDATRSGDVYTGTDAGHVVRVGVADKLSITVTEDYASAGRGSDSTGYYIAVNQGQTNANTLTHSIVIDGTTKADYTLQMYADHDTLDHASGSDTFATTDGTKSTLEKGTWGFQMTGIETKTNGDFPTSHSFGETWQKIGLSTAPTTIHAKGADRTQSYSGDRAEQYVLQYGAAAKDDQLAGVYTATVTYVVSANATL